jgi:hypothetical protein
VRIKSDLLNISSGALNTKGHKLEAEEQLVRREVVTDVGAKLGVGTMGKDVGSIPMKVVSEYSAVEFAKAAGSRCGNCKHFRNDLFVKDLKKAESPGAPIARRRAVNQIRAALLQTQNASVADAATGQDGDLDIEAALQTLGYCTALYEFHKNAGQSNEDAMTLVHPVSACPQDVRTDANPEGFFEYASKFAEQVGTSTYDSVMKQAQGKMMK